MTTEEKRNHVDNIMAVATIFDNLNGLGEDVLNYRPSPDNWTIHEHVIHCLEVDIANFTRYRVGIVKPGAEITSMDDSWTGKLNYSSIDLSTAVQTIKLIRKMTYDHFSTLIEDDWKEYKFFYDKYGVLDFETFAPVFYRHPLAHRELIDRNIELWEKNS